MLSRCQSSVSPFISYLLNLCRYLMKLFKILIVIAIADKTHDIEEAIGSKVKVSYW